jgi:4-hydroxy-tetrahydrodipicolinate synthase
MVSACQNAPTPISVAAASATRKCGADGPSDSRYPPVVAVFGHRVNHHDKQAGESGRLSGSPHALAATAPRDYGARDLRGFDRSGRAAQGRSFRFMVERSALRGSMTALVTPFDTSGALDEAAFRSFVDWQIAEGTKALVPVGTTGESPTLTHDEHKRVVEICVDVAAGRVPVIAGAGSNNTTEAVDLAMHAESAGADAVLVVTPYYNKPNQRGMYEHFAAVAQAIDVPIIIYNIPPRSIIDMTPATMGRLVADFPNVWGVKDATGKVERVSEQRMSCGHDFIQLSGEDASALGFNAHGGVGAISVTSNVAPRLVSEFQQACQDGNFAKALEYQDRLMPLHKALVHRGGRVRREICALAAGPDRKRPAFADGARRGIGCCGDRRGDAPRRPLELSAAIHTSQS